MKALKPVIALLLLTAGLPLNAGDNWHQPAGPNGNWQVEGTPPIKWSVTRSENIRWRTPLPEAGMSGVTIWGDRVFVTTHVPIKSLAENFVSIEGLSGASITGDGTVCLMLDSAALVSML